MARFIVRVEDSLHEAFQKHCERQNKTVSEMIRGFVLTELNGVVRTPVSTEVVLTNECAHKVVLTNKSVLTRIIFDPLTGEPLQ